MLRYPCVILLYIFNTISILSTKMQENVGIFLFFKYLIFSKSNFKKMPGYRWLKFVRSPLGPQSRYYYFALECKDKLLHLTNDSEQN